MDSLVRNFVPPPTRFQPPTPTLPCRCRFCSNDNSSLPHEQCNGGAFYSNTSYFQDRPLSQLRNYQAFRDIMDEKWYQVPFHHEPNPAGNRRDKWSSVR
jgi:hypothetical protein